MKLSVVMFVVAFIGTALCDVEGGGSSSTTQGGGGLPVCPEYLSDESTPMSSKIDRLRMQCFNSVKSNSSTWDKEDGTRDEIQAYYRDFCPQQLTVRECFAEKASIVELCTNPTFSKIFNIVSEISMKFIESVCSDNGERMATFMHGLNVVRNENRPTFEEFWKCSMERMVIARVVEESKVDLASKFFIFHNEIISMKKCVSETQLDQTLKDIVMYMLEEIIKTMKCVDPTGDELVPCASIDVDLLSATSVCQAKTHNSGLGIFEVLENDAGRCFDHMMTHDLGRVDVTTDNEALRDALKENCRSQGVITNCLHITKTVANVCLNETENNRFARRSDFFQSALEGACSDQGQSLATVMFEVYRLKRSGQGHAVWDCVDVAKSAAGARQLHSDAGLYHEVETFRECLKVKLGGDRASLDAAMLLINDMLGKMECIQVDTTVLCSTLSL